MMDFPYALFVLVKHSPYGVLRTALWTGLVSNSLVTWPSQSGIFCISYVPRFTKLIKGTDAFPTIRWLLVELPSKIFYYFVHCPGKSST